jgi:hypothetical protein
VKIKLKYLPIFTEVKSFIPSPLSSRNFPIQKTRWEKEEKKNLFMENKFEFAEGFLKYLSDYLNRLN